MNSGHRMLAGAANHVLGIKEGKNRFADVSVFMAKAFTLCYTLDDAKAVREEVAFFQGVKVITSPPNPPGYRTRSMNRHSPDFVIASAARRSMLATQR